MKNRNTVFITIVSALAFALAPVAKAAPGPDEWSHPAAATAGTTAQCVQRQSPAVITIHSTDNVTRGKTGSFVLDMKPALDTMPALSFGGRYVNFKVSGTAIAGVDYVLLVSPARIGKSGYGVIQAKTLPDPRGLSIRKVYSDYSNLGRWRRI